MQREQEIGRGRRVRRGLIGRLAGWRPVLTAPGRFAAAAAAIAAVTTSARATWSIILVDIRTGEVALGSATCLVGFDLKESTPVMLVGRGGVTMQSFVDGSGRNQNLIRDMMLAGASPEEILAQLAIVDTGHQSRQYGFVDTLGRAATFSGTGAGAWAGGVTGRVGDIVYAIQGNVLTGEPVVTAAEQAVLNTPGDLPAKLMAAMEAARVFGGDGRCSCPGSVTGCGSPPPSFEKSAHIGYMIISRPGDEDGCHGLYFAGLPQQAAAADFDGDGRTDLAVAQTTIPNSVRVLMNTTAPGSTYVTFAPALIVPNIGPSRDIVAADLTGDGVDDLACVNSFAASVSVFPGLGGGLFGAAVTHAVGTDPQNLVVADMDGLHGPDLVTANVAGNSITVLLDNGAGGYFPATWPVGGGIADLAAADVDGDGDTDIVYAGKTLNRALVMLNSGTGALSLGPLVTTGTTPVSIVTDDFDDDGDADFAVACSGSGQVTVILNSAGVLTPTNIAVSGSPQWIDAGSIDGDGFIDLAVVRGLTQRDITPLLGDGLGGFSPQAPSIATQVPAKFVLADLDADGLDDAAISGISPPNMVIVENAGGRFTSGLGCAAGRYFMCFNVAGQCATCPDPVFQLQDFFDEWRASLVGFADAVQSVAVVDPGVVAGNGRTRAVLHVELRDWAGGPALPATGLTVQHASDSAGLASIGAITDLGMGRYDVELVAGSGVGTDRFLVTADTPNTPAQLTPAPELVHTCAADCDVSTGVGTLDFFDFICFQDLFAAGDPSACDCDQSTGAGVCDFFDFVCYQDEFAAGC